MSGWFTDRLATRGCGHEGQGSNTSSHTCRMPQDSLGGHGDSPGRSSSGRVIAS